MLFDINIYLIILISPIIHILNVVRFACVLVYKLIVLDCFCLTCFGCSECTELSIFIDVSVAVGCLFCVASFVMSCVQVVHSMCDKTGFVFQYCNSVFVSFVYE